MKNAITITLTLFFIKILNDMFQGGSKVYDILNEYLGVNFVLISGVILFLQYFSYIKDNKLRFLFKYRIVSLYILFLSVFYTYFLGRYHYSSGNKAVLMEEVYFKYKMGVTSAWIFHRMSSWEYYYVLMICFTLMIPIILFILSAREIRGSIKAVKERKRRKIEEEALKHKIAIKEKLEKEEREKKEKFEQAREQEIREKIDELLLDGNIFEEIQLEEKVDDKTDTGIQIS